MQEEENAKPDEIKDYVNAAKEVHMLVYEYMTINPLSRNFYLKNHSICMQYYDYFFFPWTVVILVTSTHII